MNHKSAALALAIGVFLLVTSTGTQADELDVTMQVVNSPDDLPEAVTRTLSLPHTGKRKSGVAEERSTFGLETANEARNKARKKGKEHGRSVAEQAKKKGIAKGKGKGKGKGKP